jgi:hypothetical protein
VPRQWKIVLNPVTLPCPQEYHYTIEESVNSKKSLACLHKS